MALKGRASWTLNLWRRYVGAGKSAAIVRQRLELARKEARAEWITELEAAADRKLAQLESGAPAPTPAPTPARAIASDARDAGAGAGDEWWW